MATQAANAELARPLAYRETRVAQVQYPQFGADGGPIGSGMVARATTLVVADRLKGAGMHGAAANVKRLLALRNAVCNDGWAECWTVLERKQRAQVAVRRQARGRTRAATQVAAVPGAAVAALPPVRRLVRPLAPAVQSPHPWTRAGSVRRQRALAGVVEAQDFPSHPPF